MQQQTTAKDHLQEFMLTCKGYLSLKNKIADTSINMMMADIIAIHLHSFHATDQHWFRGLSLDYFFATVH